MDDPVALLRRHFGYPGFRPGQEELVRAVLQGRDAFGVLPTGGGKSVCYQVPALAQEGLTLVVTPLVSLMEDQVGRARGVGLRASHLSAVQSAQDRRETLARASDGGLDLLFVAPERLELPSFRDALRGIDVRLLAVDEAHCISEWGHDFRPSYRRIAAIHAILRCPTLALTATATPPVRADIHENLGLRAPFTVVRSFDRPNLSWRVREVGAKIERASAVYRLLRAHRGTAIVYAPTRRTVDGVRDRLAAWGVRAGAYHAGLPGAERTAVQGAFMAGDLRVVVATNAFGMGIDKADVRLVVHVQLPLTLEAYYQEAGRAGRDGAPALCVALYSRRDGRLGRRFVDRTHPTSRRLRRLHGDLLSRADDTGVVTLGADDAFHFGLDAEGGPLATLERIGAVRRLSARAEPNEADALGTGLTAARIGVRRHLDPERAVRLRRVALDKLEAVHRYASGRGCRRRALLGYFGEDAPGRCGACDRCGVSQH